MAVNSINSANSLLRLTGLGGSGIDTDEVVKQMMMAQRIPLDKLYQKKQLTEWRQDAYRDITNRLRELKDTYFNLAKPDSNLMSAATFIKYTGVSSNSSYVTVSGNADSVAGSHTVTVLSLAEAGKAVSSGKVTDKLEGNEISDFNFSGKTIKLTLDGITRELTLDDYNDIRNLVTKEDTGLQALADKAFGSGKIAVTYDEESNKISFDTEGGASKLTLSSGSANNGLGKLGFTSGATNRLDINKSLESLSSLFAKDLTFGTNGKLEFTINSKRFIFDKSTSLVTMMNTINSDTDAQVVMGYDETSDRFVFTARQMGYGENITIGTSQKGNFFGARGASGILTGGATTEQGKDASARIDGRLVTRSSNTFVLSGITYTLVKAHENPGAEYETISLSADSQGVFESIKGFVDKYNEIIAEIHSKLTEKYDRSYQPLTDDQKANLKDIEIEKWEAIAKTGLLRSDPILQDIVNSMRRALSDSIAGVSASLQAIGITTGHYSDNGKLIIDEAKLKAAIEKDPNAVSELFTKNSGISYSGTNSLEQRTQRYANQGLARRISDILDDNIRTVSGKGKLLEKAGVKGDTTEFRSATYNQIRQYDKEIEAMIERLQVKEDRYYAQFTAMEKYISRMYAQSDWLFAQFNSMSQW